MTALWTRFPIRYVAISPGHIMGVGLASKPMTTNSFQDRAMPPFRVYETGEFTDSPGLQLVSQTRVLNVIQSRCTRWQSPEVGKLYKENDPLPKPAALAHAVWRYTEPEQGNSHTPVTTQSSKRLPWVVAHAYQPSTPAR